MCVWVITFTTFSVSLLSNQSVVQEPEEPAPSNLNSFVISGGLRKHQRIDSTLSSEDVR